MTDSQFPLYDPPVRVDPDMDRRLLVRGLVRLDGAPVVARPLSSEEHTHVEQITAHTDVPVHAWDAVWELGESFAGLDAGDLIVYADGDYTAVRAVIPRTRYA